MDKYYYSLDRIIKEEIENGQEIAIYPTGKIGVLANIILKTRYGKVAYLIDNVQANYANNIFTLDDFCLKKDCEHISIIICRAEMKKSLEHLYELKGRNIKARIRNVLEAPVKHFPDKESYFQQIVELCKVKKCIDYELVRIGKPGDGGYIMLNDFKESKIAYSFGIGGDMSWDKCMANKGVKVYCYDPTIDCLPEEHVQCNFNKIGISGTDKEKENLYTLETILKQNQHNNIKNMILKMDVEGVEWDFLGGVSADTLEKFSMMTFELHNLTDLENSRKTLRLLEKLNMTHQAIWIHANNSRGVERAGKYDVPGLLEITYVNKRKYRFEDVEYNCPMDLDYPNNTEYLDVELCNW